MGPVTFGSLFTGIGGMDLGLERAGMECRWQVEIDPFCQRVLTKHWPNVAKYRDVRELTGEELEQVGCIAGGFPCQPVSVAGKQLAQQDERWLWPEFFRIVRSVRPRFAIVENVPGLLVRGMGDVLGDLASIGYDTDWDCIPAASVGAPHLRYRVIIVANCDRWRCESEWVKESCQQQGSCGSEPYGRSEIWQFEYSSPLSEISNPTGARLEKRNGIFFGGARPHPTATTHQWWATEPDVGRVANGVPSRVDRLTGLGNAVVPQIAEWIGRRILEASL